MKTVYILESERSYEQTREPADDGWDRGDSACYVDVLGVSLSLPKIPFDQVDTDEDIDFGDTVYLVIARYGDGDTFGYDEGYMWYGLVTKEKWRADRAQSDPRSTGKYLPWEGYFAGLSQIWVEEFIIGE